MKVLKLPKLPALGAPAGGGFFAGIYLQGNTLRRLYVAGQEGDLVEQVWNSTTTRVKDALSMEDGLANTRAMAKAGSVLAQKMIELRIGGHRDWCLTSHDQAYTVWKNLKFNTAGAALLKKKGGGELADAVYWTSTQSAAFDGFAWVQTFYYGSQDGWLKGSRGRGRAVRSEPI
jgi:hypothetical protein